VRARIIVPIVALAALLPVAWILSIRLDDLINSGRFTSVLTGIVLAFATAAVVSEKRRPGRRVAPLIATLAVLVLVTAFRFFPSPWWSAIGALLWLAGPLVIADLLVSYPDGLTHRARRFATFVFWTVPSVLAIAIVAVSGPRRDGGSAVRAVTWSLAFKKPVRRQGNPLLVHESAALVRAFTTIWIVWVVAALVGTGTVLIRRWRHADRADRRIVVPISLAGVVAALGVATQVAATWPVRDPYARGAVINLDSWYGDLLGVPAIAALPVLAGVLIWLEVLRPQLARAAGNTLQLPNDTVGDLEGGLRRSLADPTLILVFHDPNGGWIDASGRSVSLQARADRAITIVTRGSEEIAAIDHDVALLARADEVEGAARVVAVAIENERLRALTLAQAESVRASGARLLESADRARRDVERQIVVGPVPLIQRAETELTTFNGAPADALNRSADLVLSALHGVRTISHGLAPPTLDQHGLAAALEDLVERSDLPITITATITSRLPRAIETSVYVAVAHALAASSGPLTIHCAAGGTKVELAISGQVGHPDDIVRDRIAALGGTVLAEPQHLVIAIPLLPSGETVVS
jgi:hypothetical protein